MTSPQAKCIQSKKENIDVSVEKINEKVKKKKKKKLSENKMLMHMIHFCFQSKSLLIS